MPGTVPIDPYGDKRVEHCVANLNDNNYHYILGTPKDGWTRTIFLVHGFPDLAMGWRYQIPYLVDLGFRVVVPDMIGYGGTDAPQALEMYSIKRVSDDLAELAKQLGAEKIILGGHDWGGAVVWRAVMWHPNLVSHVFSVCTPVTKVAMGQGYMSVEDLAKALPQFGYQIQLAGPDVEREIQSKDKIRQFLNGIYSATGPNKEPAFEPAKGVLLENLDKIRKSPLVTDKVMDFYVEQYARNGLRGPLNWYRTRKINYNEEQALTKLTVDVPSLFILADKDNVLTPELARGIEKYVPNLTRAEVHATHWALLEKPDEVNDIIKKWLHNCGLLPKSTL